MLKPAAMVGWSGAGRFEDLERTVVRKLRSARKATDHIDGTMLVTAEDPVVVARQLAFLPGVAWISVGYRFSGNQDYLKTLELLAKRYLSKRKTFRISAQVVGSELTAGDVVLAGNSALLSSVTRAKVDERRPNVKFRVCIEGVRGACGVEIRAGTGGVPTRDDWVSCLVSGGERSSSLAWMAALSGFSLRLVHSKTGEAALRHVAKLYSELSFRIDPRCVELVVLDGGKNAAGRIGRWLGDSKMTAFAGMRPARSDALTEFARRFPNLILPLILVQDEAIRAVYRSLGLGPASKDSRSGGLTLKSLQARSPYSEKRFGGVQADSNTVIDEIKRGN
jgi:hypothetical protein